MLCYDSWHGIYVKALKASQNAQLYYLGSRGCPRPRRPFPLSGLMGKPEEQWAVALLSSGIVRLGPPCTNHRSRPTPSSLQSCRNYMKNQAIHRT